MILCVIYWAATGALLAKYHGIPSLVAAAIFSIISGFLHLAQSVWLCKAIKVTQIAREALNFGHQNSPTSASPENEGSKQNVAYESQRENVVVSVY